ncbi:MAG: hypothetical protein CML60_02470 [Rhodobacteraceae bacterium]|nr:hypothetical protein [Paracoccaceae bacterium]MBT25258.1 hypothetical protein [Paracoccaceae bacterium]|tara:strand:- start:679 stop:939 length:261 start_codon:yes stop_codon:yes gene_type:complete
MSFPEADKPSDKETDTQKHIKRLIKRIECFCSEKSWSEGYFSKVSAGDVGVVERLRTTGKVTGAKMVQIEKYLDCATAQSLSSPDN